MNEPISPNTTIAHYSMVAKIGEGGMGEVYQALDTRLDRKVAIKFLNEEFSRNEDKLSRFIQEAKAASALNHPNILTVYEIGEVDGKHYISTELIDGQTVRQQLSQREPLPLNTILKIGVQVAEALSAAHHAGIIHRDIKPENIMIRKDGYAKVLDFGLAKLSEPAAGMSSGEDVTRALVKTIPGMVMGTVSYMSPEQARGKETDARTDIWSLGVVLYEMLARRVPFTGETINHTIVAILEREPPALGNVPPELQRIVRKAITKDVDMRYQSARDLLIDLKSLRRDLDIQGELERSVIPNSEPASSFPESATRMFTSDTFEATRSGHAQSTQSVLTSTSSLEYAVNQARSHKVGTALVGILLVGVISAVAYFRFFPRGGNTGQVTSIAILPFQNKSDDPNTDYLSDGLAESLIFRLSQLPGLKVSSTSSVFRYKGKETDAVKVGTELGVNAVMSGRMVQRGDNLTISVELVDVRNNTTLWGEQFERKMSDLLATQREIATAITEKLQLKLSGADAKGLNKQYTQSNEAYQLYLKGRYYYNKRSKDGLERAIASFRQAIELDRNFALAHVGISDSYFVMPSYAYLSPKEATPQSLNAARRALQIDADLAEAHSSYASGLTVERNWAEAEHEFRRALELNPNVAEIHYRYGLEYLAPLGRLDESIVEIRRALDLEPLSIPMSANLAGVHLYARKNDLALEYARKAAALDPNHPTAKFWLGWAYNANGMYSEAISLCEQALSTDQNNQDLLQILGYAYAKVGRRSEVENVIKRFEQIARTQYVVAYRVGNLYAMLGDKDRAFAEIEKSLAASDWDINRIKVDPFMDSLRDDPRFKEILKRLNLPE
ncbi:MAG: protein kinase domain-containing protein [Pyrinomonadaceae bacterium]